MRSINVLADGTPEISRREFKIVSADSVLEEAIPNLPGGILFEPIEVGWAMVRLPSGLTRPMYTAIDHVPVRTVRLLKMCLWIHVYDKGSPFVVLDIRARQIPPISSQLSVDKLCLLGWGIARIAGCPSTSKRGRLPSE